MDFSDERPMMQVDVTGSVYPMLTLNGFLSRFVIHIQGSGEGVLSFCLCFI